MNLERNRKRVGRKERVRTLSESKSETFLCESRIGTELKEQKKRLKLFCES